MNAMDLPWEDRNGEAYLCIHPEVGAFWSGVDLELAVLEANLLNIDLPRLRQVIEEASNRPEYVGPGLQRTSQERLQCLVWEQTQEEVILKFTPQTWDLKPQLTLKEVEIALKKRNVRAGIDWNLLSAALRDKKPGPHLAAQKKPAKQGEPARILQKVNFNDLNKPKLLEDGRVDFRSLDQILQVKTGQTLAIKMPHGLGEKGTELDGTELPAIPGEDLDLSGGENTLLSGDGRELTSALDGFAYIDSEGRLSVGALFVVDGDVNFKCGNINYQGDVLIRGNVMADFVVQATGSIQIEGDVEAAQILAGANLTIDGGVFGREKAKLQAKNILRVRSAQDCSLKAEKLEFERTLKNCTIDCGILLSKSPNSMLSSCQIKVSKIAQIVKVGPSGANPTQIEVLYAREIEVLGRIREAERLRDIESREGERLLGQLQSMKAILKRSEEVSPRAAEELRKSVEAYQETQRKVEAFNRKLELLEKSRLDRSGFTGRVEVEIIDSTLIVVMLHDRKEIKLEARKQRLRWKDNAILQENLEADWKLGRFQV
jgi:uncharacterized protein (DUF342 family)